MIQDSILIWKILSLLFLSFLILFLFYIILEKLLSRLEFKRKLRLVKDQLLFDIFRDYNSKAADSLVLDSFSEIELQTRIALNDLKKKIFCDLSRYDLKDLESKVNDSFKEKEKKINKIVLNKYKEAIKSLNQKMIFLKNELDAFKSIFNEKANNVIDSKNILINETDVLKNKETLIKNIVKEYLNNNSDLSYNRHDVDKNTNIDLNYVNKKINESYNNNYIRLNSSIKNIEKSIESKINSMIQIRDDYVNKQITYLMQTNDKLSAEKIKIFEQLQEKTDKFMKDNMSKIYEMINAKDNIIKEKNDLIIEQKSSISDLQRQLIKQNEFMENQLKNFSLDKEYLDKYISSLKRQSIIQKSKNNIFIFAIVLLFIITLTMFLLVLTKSPLIYTLY